MAQMTSLKEMNAGQKAQVQKLDGDEAVCFRLLEMGITPGTQLEVVRFAPLGDPIDIKVRGYHLSLRQKEAEVIKVVIS
ncbi:MAG: ferrous iron transport protein A [Candidatus Omnitrophota bacterium]